MAVKLHRCGGTWIKGPHPCWQVQKALDESGIEYEAVKGPLRRGKRDGMQALTGPWYALPSSNSSPRTWSRGSGPGS